MEHLEKNIEDWIKPYATIVGERIDVDVSLKKSNPAQYFLRLTLPNHFESYAISLHSFWINYKVSEKNIRSVTNDDIELPEKDFIRINWKTFYELKGVTFDLNSSILDLIQWRNPFKQMNNELYPGEGLMDEEHLQSFVNVVVELYGNQEIEIFYTFLSIKDSVKDLMFGGKIMDLPALIKKEELKLTPSLIYSKEKNWVINTDYDLAFSTIGGKSELINKLIVANKDEIYKVEY